MSRLVSLSILVVLLVIACGYATANCPGACPLIYDPYCANGRTFMTKCEMDKYECDHNVKFTTFTRGPCRFG